jgi:hypothetical protein
MWESWTADEDQVLAEYVLSHAGSSWSDVPKATGLVKSYKSCHLRWLNHLSPVSVKLRKAEQETVISLCEAGISFEEIAERVLLDNTTYKDVASFLVNYMNDTILPWRDEWPGMESKETEEYSAKLKLSSHGGNERDATCIERNHTNAWQINSTPIQLTPEYGLQIIDKDVIHIDTSENNDTTRNDTHGDDGTDDQNYNRFLSADSTENERDATWIHQNGTDFGQPYTIAVPPIPEDDLHIQNKCVVMVDYPENIDTTRKDHCHDHDHDDHEGDDQNKVPGYITTKICISFEDLKKHFDMNLEDAAESLHVSRSSLKRICRDYSIKRWPCRKRRKINHQQRADPDSANKLVQKNKDQIKQPTRIQAKVISAPGNISDSRSASNVIIKATCGEDIIRFRLSVSSGVTELREKIGERLELEMQSFRLKYKDDAGDLVLIACDEDLHDFLSGNSLSRSFDHGTTFDISVFPVSNHKSIKLSVCNV